MLGLAAAAAVANAIALAAPAGSDSEAPESRLGTALKDAQAKRTAAAAAEKRKLEMREQAVKASEARLAERLRQQQESQATAGPDRNAGGQEQVPYDSLARIYQTMRPNRAGPIFEKLDLEVQREVASRIRERAMAQIMANMSPQGAVALSMAMAGRKVVPVKTGS